MIMSINDIVYSATLPNDGHVHGTDGLDYNDW